MVETCLSYLCNLDHSFFWVPKLRVAYPFARYCAKYWTDFATVAEDRSESVQHWINFFFNHEKALTTSCYLFHPYENVWEWCRLDHTPSPLFYALSTGMRIFALSLLEADCDANSQGEIDYDALYAASGNGDDEIVRKLLYKGVDVHNQGSYGPALTAASVSRHEKVIQILLDWGADVNAQEERTGTTLMLASEFGHNEIVQLLLNRGADVNAKSKSQRTALTAASLEGHEKVVQILLDWGTDVNAQGGDSGTALLSASKCGTALLAAPRRGHDGIVRRLLDKSADANAKFEPYNFEEALRHNHEQYRRLIIDDVADQDRYDYDTAILRASRLGLDEIVQILLLQGQKLNEIHDHTTALTIASRFGKENIVRMLLDRGAELKGRYYQDWGEAIQAASFRGHFTIERILLDHEVKEDTLSRYLEIFPPPSTPDDPRGRIRLEKENECRSIIYTAMRGKEADFKELIDRHKFLSEHRNTDPHNHNDDSSGSANEVEGVIDREPPRKRARRGS